MIDDAEWLRTQIETLTSTQESQRPVPWKVTDAPEQFISGQIKAIIGVEIPIGTIEGKWKVSQNRSEQDRTGVAKGLADLNTTESLEMKALVDERN